MYQLFTIGYMQTFLLLMYWQRIALYPVVVDSWSLLLLKLPCAVA